MTTREYGPGRPLVFSHIPKTAGTSLRESLAAALHPQRMIGGFDRSLVGGYDDVAALRRADPGAVHLRPEDIDPTADLVAGHIAPATTMARFPGADHITMLREPRLRVLSQWMHSRSLSEFDIRRFRGGVAEAFRVGRGSLHAYLEHAMLAPNLDNTIARFLAWPHPALEQTRFVDGGEDRSVLDAATERLDGFGFVGLVEDPEAITALGDWLGRDLPVVRSNDRSTVPPKWPTDLDAELDESTLALLDERTRLDRELWRTVVGRVLPDTDPEQLARTGWERTVARYRETIAAPRRTDRPVRRTVETAYGALHRLRHR